jgi:hypothetical protein
VQAASSTSTANASPDGINLPVLAPGQPMTMYHRERYKRDSSCCAASVC